MANSLLDNFRARLKDLNSTNVLLALEGFAGAPEIWEARNAIPILNASEALIEVDTDMLVKIDPHTYRSLGAQYDDKSPFSLRADVWRRLLMAQEKLNELRPGFKLLFFDGYRPIAVQKFMVDYSLKSLARERGLELNSIHSEVFAKLESEVFKSWARPSEDPCTPPPHSTGSAVDVTILDANLTPLPMGGEIDEMSEVSLPNYYLAKTGDDSREYHENRELLNLVMREAGFRRLPFEWWHFSYGDQYWALVKYLEGEMESPEAIYGRV